MIKFEERHRKRETSRRFGVGESRVRNMRKQKKLTDLPSKRCRPLGGNSKPQAPGME